MKNLDASGHVSGRSIYLDDIPEREGTLHAAVFGSPVAHGRLIHLDSSAARAMEGVVAILTAADIPGENQVGGIIPDEPLLAEHEIHFVGQAIAIVVATSEEHARSALAALKVEIDPLPVITDPREAFALGDLITPPRSFAIGDVDNAWSDCAYIFEGRAESGGQEHLYIECQGAYAHVDEGGHLKVYSSTQGPTAVQRTVAKVLGLGMHMIELDVTRLGGGFGGKEDQATPWACKAALAAWVLQRPVKLVLHRLDDMHMTGKRHPYSSDFKIGLDAHYKIIAYQVHFYQNAGATADLSPAILERTLFHHTNCYYIPNSRATAYSCRTNLPPNTAFRGFGGPQGMFVIESAIAYAAEALGIDAARIQEANLIADGQPFPYGQKVKGDLALASWRQARRAAHIEQLEAEVAHFNASQSLQRRGLAHMPICFGISFTNKALNQSAALIHLYQDGSVSLSTGAVEMGQGVNTKMAQVAAACLGISVRRVRVEATNTTRVANTSPTAASSGADLNGKAVEKAALALHERLCAFAREKLGQPDAVTEVIAETVHINGQATALTWVNLVRDAYWSRISLSEQAFYATPGIHFDKRTEKGEPFAYHVFGTAIFQVTVDCLRGRYVVDRVEIAHDFGTSLNPHIDLGQVEGALVQGIGWMTMEEVMFREDGRCISGALSTYKVPDIYSVPKELVVSPLECEGPERAIFRSKAVGEPPLMYGIGVYFAIRNAIRAFRSNQSSIAFEAPMTPERVLMALYPQPVNERNLAGVAKEQVTS